MKTIFIFILSVFTVNLAFTQITFGPASNGTTYNTCNDFLIDSGGQGGTGYGVNELQTITICPDTPNEIISITFNLFSLDLTNTGTQQNPDLDQMSVFDGMDVNAPTLGSYTGNGLQQVVIQATQLNPTGCITLQFYSNNLGTGQFSASVSCETPCNDPFAGAEIIGGITTDSIRVCIGETVNFQNTNSSAAPGFILIDYQWDFMDGTSAQGQSASHAYDVAGEYRVQLYVTDDNGCSNPNLVDLQVLVGTEPTFIGFPGDTTLCLGEQLTLTADPVTYQQIWNGFSGVQAVDDGCLYDSLLGVAQEIPLLQTGFNAGATVNSMADLQSLCIEMEHSFMGDLVLIVQCPNGQSVTLHQQGGGGTQLGVPIQTDNVDCDDPTTQGVPSIYCFTPQATETWVGWVANQGGFGLTLPPGDYASVNPLDGLIGCPLNGIWTLNVIDNWAADDGTVFSFGVNFDPSLYPAVTQFEPQIGPNSDSSFWAAGQFITNMSPDGNVIDLNITTPGTYVYEYFVTDDFGCTNDSTVTVTMEGNPQANAGLDTTICGQANAQVQLNGSILGGANSGSPCTYALLLEDSFGDSWNGNTIDVTINGTTTNYTVGFNNNGGSSNLINLNIPHGASISLTFNATGNWINECEFTLTDPNGTVIYQDGQVGSPSTATQSFVADCYGGFVFEWTSPTNLNDPTVPNPVATLSNPETFTLSIYPIGHPLCVTTDDVNVNLAQVPDAGNDSVLTICADGAPQDLFPLLGPNAETTNAIWLDPNNAVINMPYDPLTMDGGTYKYVVGVGCTDTAEVIVTEVVISLTSNLTDSDCNACNGVVEVNALNNTNPTQYSLDGIAFQPTNVFTSICPGTYTVSVIDDLGCGADLSVTINEINLPTIDLVTVTNVDCNAANNGAVDIAGSNVTQYEIDGPTGIQTNATGSFTNLAPGNYTVTVDNGFGCTAIDNFVVTEPNPLIITNIISDSVICEGATIDLFVAGQGGSSPITFEWTENTAVIGTGNTLTVSPQASTQYCVTITEACGSPTQTECVTVTNPTVIQPVLTPDITGACFPFEVVFTNNTNSSEVAFTEISFGDGTDVVLNGLSPVAHTYQQAGIYDVNVQITSVFGCEYSVSYPSLITAYDYPEADFNSMPSPVSMFDTEVQLTSSSSSDVVGFNWSFTGADIVTSSLEDPMVNYPELEVGSYPVQLIVTNANGCSDTIVKDVNVISDVLFFAPNTFTPDDNEFNQNWSVSILGIDVYDFNVKVFNRWGQIMFESNDPNGAWDGTYGGKLVPSGMYAWILETKDAETDARYKYQGHVTVLR